MKDGKTRCAWVKEERDNKGGMDKLNTRFSSFWSPEAYSLSFLTLSAAFISYIYSHSTPSPSFILAHCTRKLETRAGGRAWIEEHERSMEQGQYVHTHCSRSCRNTRLYRLQGRLGMASLLHHSKRVCCLTFHLSLIL